MKNAPGELVGQTKTTHISHVKEKKEKKKGLLKDI
jgi:hypothetical protein